MSDQQQSGTDVVQLEGNQSAAVVPSNSGHQQEQQLEHPDMNRSSLIDQAGNRDANVQKQTRPSSANRAKPRPHSVGHTLHWFACVGGDDLESGCTTGSNGNNNYSNHDSQLDGNEEEREERIKQMKERQNEDRQRKLEELKAQALAAQKFREQKEEERRRRMEDLRKRENDRRSQVEERRRAIQEADNERRQYILQKNQERDQRMEAKRRNERSSIVFAFGSSTPRMLETADSGMCSSFWANRRATSITNVAYTGAPLTRRSSERELTDGSSKKRATSASGLDRSTDDDSGDMSYQRTVNRRKTDLMPTIPSPRDSSRSSLGTHTPRTPGRAFSMTRLDQLAQPLRRNGEHISAIVERERRQALDPDNQTQLSLSSSRSSPTTESAKRMSRSMSQLASAGTRKIPCRARKSSFNTSSSGGASPMGRADTSKSMSQLNTAGRSLSGSSSRVTRTERLRQQLNGSFGQPHNGGMSPNATGLRSGEITPNNGLSGSRPGSAMSTSTTASGVVYRRSLPSSAGSHQRKPRPISIAVTGVSMTGGVKEEKPPLPKPSSAGFNNSSSTGLERKRSQQSGTSTPAKPPIGSGDGGATHHKKPSSERIQRVPSIGSRSSSHNTPKASSTPLQSPGPDKANRTLQDSLQHKEASKAKKQLPVDEQKQPLSKQGSSISAKSTEEKTEVTEQKVQQNQQLQESVVVQSETVTTVVETVEVQSQQPLQPEQQQQIIVTETKTEEVHTAESLPEEKPQILEQSHHEEKQDETKEDPALTSGNLELSVQDGSTGDLMTASMMAKKITTEEEAKAALAERRRLAREEAERQAELERQRIAAEEAAEQQRQFEEEERLRKLEEESIRLAEEQRRLEEERLEQAIQEAQKRDEEEKQRREEEARQKVEREEQERKTREEAERQRIEMAERLKKEEKEREERRKRVEAIMSRTRAKGSANNTPTKQSEDGAKDSAMSKSVIVSSSNPSMADSTLLMTNSVMLETGSLDLVTEAGTTASEKPSSPSLEQAVQSLSLNSVEEHDTANQQQHINNSINNNNDSTSLNNNHNNNNNNNSTRTDYERSVTEKENLLLGSFNNNLNNSSSSNNSVAHSGADTSSSSNSSSLQPSSLESSGSVLPAGGATTNGKSTPGATSIAETTELIIEDAIMSGQTNGHKNGSIDNVLLRVSEI